MWPAVIWLGLGLLLALTEVLSGEFVLLMLGGGALAAGVAALVGAPVAVTAIVFALVAVLLVFAVRPPLKRRLTAGLAHQLMHSDALVGREGVVIAKVDGHGGRVKIGGELWSAKSHDGDVVIEEGEPVTVLQISGATALVVPR